MLYLILLVASASGVLWMQIWLMISGLGKKTFLRPIPHPDAFQKLIENTGIPIQNVMMIDSPKPFATMTSTPGHPFLVVSSAVYNTFTRDELEYVVQHEAAHYKFNHTLLEGAVFLFSYGFCCLLLWAVVDSFTWLITIPLLALLITISTIQIARLFELQAETYAAKHMTNPRGMISATQKFKEFYGDHPPEQSRRRWLFYRGVPYSERITIATHELERRK